MCSLPSCSCGACGLPIPWVLILPGFTFISWGAFILGLVGSFAGGFLTAVLFVPLYNYFAGRATREAPMPTPAMTASPHH